MDGYQETYQQNMSGIRFTLPRIILCQSALAVVIYVSTSTIQHGKEEVKTCWGLKKATGYY